MITNFRHAGIVVFDLNQSLRFWCDLLGFTIQKRQDEKGQFIDNLLGMTDVYVTTCKLIGPNGILIELLKYHSHPDLNEWKGLPNSTGLTHLAFTVDDIDSLYDSLKKAGVDFKCRPLISDDGGVKVTYAVGPEKLLLELVEVLNK
jgi:catechol 2,3-dioxygenase-like lactoylglutathione lyase family enzyme